MPSLTGHRVRRGVAGCNGALIAAIFPRGTFEAAGAQRDTPNAFCEFTGPSYNVIALYPGSFSATTHRFPLQHIQIFGIWGFGCFLDGAEWTSRTDSTLGFSSGGSMTIQGETDAPYSQVGALAPSKTSWTSLNYEIGTSWAALTPVCEATDSHYDHSCP